VEVLGLAWASELEVVVSAAKAVNHLAEGFKTALFGETLRIPNEHSIGRLALGKD